jgi:hypothetical protein
MIAVLSEVSRLGIDGGKARPRGIGDVFLSRPASLVGSTAGKAAVRREACPARESRSGLRMALVYSRNSLKHSRS